MSQSLLLPALVGVVAGLVVALAAIAGLVVYPLLKA